MKPDKEYTGRATIRMYNCDCMDLMQSGKTWDLAIVDPPYGIGNWIPNNISKTGKKASERVDWNESIPESSYFNQLNSVSGKNIIWGANYYNCFLNGGGVVWFKGFGNPKFSHCEIASLSFQKKVDYVHIDWQSGFFRVIKEGEQIHQCQKPVKLYKWLLKNYAKPGDTILDTHGGSLSIAIACWDLGFDLDVCELDKDYFDAAVKRFENHIAQQALF